MENKIQENSFACIKCGLYHSEESGAFEGFTCELCIKPFANAESFEKYLDSDVSLEYRDNNFHYLFLDCDNCNNHASLHALPSWLETIDNRPGKELYSHGSKGEYIQEKDIYVNTLADKVFLLSGQKYNPDKETFCRYIDGYYCNLSIGDIIIIDDIKLVFVDTVSLPAEVEHQCEDSSLVYEYRGSSYLQIFVKL